MMDNLIAFPTERATAYRRRLRADDDAAYESWEGRVIPFIDPLKEAAWLELCADAEEEARLLEMEMSS
jgi:hypothetical protein